MLAIGCVNPLPSVRLSASLFSDCGKLAVQITALGDDRATVTTARRPTAGSFAYLVRNGIKVAVRVAWASGNSLGLSFDDPGGPVRQGRIFLG
jgi:hypothetical protein